MNRQDQKAVTELLTQYSKALNSSDAEALAGLYVSDGLFMPNGALPVKGTEISESAKRFLRQNKISLAFEFKEIVVDGDFAFVQARSSCAIHQQSAVKEVKETSKDFFVLRKENQQWKVFRYMFNK